MKPLWPDLIPVIDLPFLIQNITEDIAIDTGEALISCLTALTNYVPKS